MPRSGLIPQKLDNFLHRSARSKKPRYTDCCEFWNVALGNYAANQHADMIQARFLQEFHDARHKREMGATEKTQTEPIRILIANRTDDGFRSLPQTGVDDFHARVAQCAGDYFDASVVAVKSDFGQDDTEW
jgi:hypothetical protein